MAGRTAAPRQTVELRFDPAVFFQFAAADRSLSRKIGREATFCRCDRRTECRQPLLKLRRAITPGTPIVGFVKRLRCSKCGSRNVLATRKPPAQPQKAS